MRFDRPILRAIVAEGRYSDPAAARYLVKTLLERRDAVGRAFFGRVTPLDNLRLRPGAICGTDLGVLYRLAQHGVVLPDTDT